MQRRCLTVLVARLSKGLPFGENDGHRQILEGRDVEEGGVLVVTDVFVVNVGLVPTVRGTGAGDITGTTGGQKRDQAADGKRPPKKIHSQNRNTDVFRPVEVE